MYNSVCYLKLNDFLHFKSGDGSVAGTVTLYLDKNDKVDVYLKSGKALTDRQSFQ